MRRKAKYFFRFISIAFAFCAVASLSSCRKSGTDKTIYYPVASSPKTLDPQFTNDVGAGVIINNVFEGLVRLSPEGEILPGVAESWSVSDDRMSYVFKIKKGCEWYCPVGIKKTHGDELYEKFSKATITADDFVFACRRAVSDEILSPLHRRLFVIKNAPEIYDGTVSEEKLGVYADDKLTLRFVLSERCDDFLRRLSESEFMPCNEEFYEAMGGRYGLSSRHILCNGPFYVSSWDSETSLTAKANRYYRGEQTVLPRSVVFSFNNDLQAVADKLGSGALSAAFLAPDIEAPKGVKIEKELSSGVYGIAFNCSDSVISCADLRRAICFAVDPGIFDGDGSGFVPSVCLVDGSQYHSAAAPMSKKIKYSQTKAQQYFNQALEELDKARITVGILCTEAEEENLKKQAQEWQKLFGAEFSVKIETLTEPEIEKRITADDFQLAFTSVTSGYSEAFDFLSSFDDGGIFNFDPQEYNRVIDSMKTEKIGSYMLPGCCLAENYILTEAIFYPLREKVCRLVTAGDVEGVYINGAESTVCFINARRFD
ncbi:MAG: peptide ABC transporter substrate-binding protein [Clostridiales bacterium]|nr:peptide ABC transporter substrate-binding protein [Clostridiales bacterium]